MTEQAPILNTGWKRIDDVIRMAQKRNLEVTVHNRTAAGINSIAVEIGQRVNPERDDMLAVHQRADLLALHWCWAAGPGRTPRLASVFQHAFLADSRDLIKDAKKYRHLSVYDVIRIAMDRMAELQEAHP